MPEDPTNFLPPGGNYQDLLSYKKSEIICDFTFRFCENFLKRGDRTIDQMVQAARSGKQNLAEGSKASITSTEMELKLTNVARASLEELLLDYQDFLRVRDFPLWEKNSKEALYTRKLGRTDWFRSRNRRRRVRAPGPPRPPWRENIPNRRRRTLQNKTAGTVEGWRSCQLVGLLQRCS